MFHFGFSYVGLIFLLMLFIPNFFWTRNIPADYKRYAANEKPFFVVCEKIGQVLSTVLVLIFSDFNINQIRIASIFLLLAFLFMVLYEIFWIRYFKSPKTMKDFYSSILGIPVAGATLPVVAFFLLSIYGANSFLMISTIILGIGHIGIHLQHRNEVCGKPNPKILVKVFKAIGLVFLTVIVLSLTIYFAMENVNFIKASVQ